MCGRIVRGSHRYITEVEGADRRGKSGTRTEIGADDWQLSYERERAAFDVMWKYYGIEEHCGVQTKPI